MIDHSIIVTTSCISPSKDNMFRIFSISIYIHDVSYAKVDSIRVTHHGVTPRVSPGCSPTWAPMKSTTSEPTCAIGSFLAPIRRTEPVCFATRGIAPLDPTRFTPPIPCPLYHACGFGLKRRKELVGGSKACLQRSIISSPETVIERKESRRQKRKLTVRKWKWLKCG